MDWSEVEDPCLTPGIPGEHTWLGLVHLPPLDLGCAPFLGAHGSPTHPASSRGHCCGRKWGTGMAGVPGSLPMAGPPPVSIYHPAGAVRATHEQPQQSCQRPLVTWLPAGPGMLPARLGEGCGLPAAESAAPLCPCPLPARMLAGGSLFGELSVRARLQAIFCKQHPLGVGGLPGPRVRAFLEGLVQRRPSQTPQSQECKALASAGEQSAESAPVPAALLSPHPIRHQKQQGPLKVRERQHPCEPQGTPVL